MIGIINYGSGNINSIANIYKRLNIDYLIINSPDELFRADKLILPGVGDFDETMALMEHSGFKKVLNHLVLDKEVPILGVCVGMQIMGNTSEEGNLDGFGWINGAIKQIDIQNLNSKPHIPHLGWNTSLPVNDTALFEGVDLEKGFYFLHSYYFECESEKDILASTVYGKTIPTAVNSKNVYGVQFHPEKSHENGVAIYKNFANI